VGSAGAGEEESDHQDGRDGAAERARGRDAPGAHDGHEGVAQAVVVVPVRGDGELRNRDLNREFETRKHAATSCVAVFGTLLGTTLPPGLLVRHENGSVPFELLVLRDALTLAPLRVADDEGRQGSQREPEAQLDFIAGRQPNGWHQAIIGELDAGADEGGRQPENTEKHSQPSGHQPPPIDGMCEPTRDSPA
jgi:hypothetical protein